MSDPLHDSDIDDDSGSDDGPARLPEIPHHPWHPDLHFVHMTHEPVDAIVEQDEQFDQCHEHDGVGRTVVEHLEEKEARTEAHGKAT